MKSTKLRFVVFMGILLVNLLKGAEAPSDARYEVAVDEYNPVELVLTKRRPNGGYDLTFGSATGQERIDLQTALSRVDIISKEGEHMKILASTQYGVMIPVEFDLTPEGVENVTVGSPISTLIPQR